MLPAVDLSLGTLIQHVGEHNTKTTHNIRPKKKVRGSTNPTDPKNNSLNCRPNPFFHRNLDLKKFSIDISLLALSLIVK